MKNIYSEKYEPTPEQRLLNQLLSRKTNRSQQTKQKLTPAQKLELKSLNPSDRLKYLRNLDTPNTDMVTK